MRMGFATVFISDEDKAIDFYTEKLGFRLVVNFPTPMGTRFLMVAPPGGGAKIVLSKPVPGMAGTVGGFTNIAYEADDVQATYEALKAKGVNFTQAPKAQPWGGVQARFADQDGNIFQLNSSGTWS